MKRLIFYLATLGVIGLLVGFVLFGDFFAFNGTGESGIDLLEGLFDSIKNGSFRFGTNSYDVRTYGLALSVIILAATVFTMLIMLLIARFRLSGILKFYSVSLSVFFAVFVLAVTFGYYVYDLVSTFNEKLTISSFSWQAYISIAASLGLVILGFIFKKGEDD